MRNNIRHFHFRANLVLRGMREIYTFTAKESCTYPDGKMTDLSIAHHVPSDGRVGLEDDHHVALGRGPARRLLQVDDHVGAPAGGVVGARGQEPDDVHLQGGPAWVEGAEADPLGLHLAGSSQ